MNYLSSFLRSKKYLKAKIIKNGDYNNITFSGLFKYEPERKDYFIVIVSDMICPIPAVYDNTTLYVFSKTGKIIDQMQLASVSGGLGDMKTVTSSIDDRLFIKQKQKLLNPIL